MKLTHLNPDTTEDIEPNNFVICEVQLGKLEQVQLYINYNFISNRTNKITVPKYLRKEIMLISL